MSTRKDLRLWPGGRVAGRHPREGPARRLRGKRASGSSEEPLLDQTLAPFSNCIIAECLRFFSFKPRVCFCVLGRADATSPGDLVLLALKLSPSIWTDRPWRRRLAASRLTGADYDTRWASLAWCRCRWWLQKFRCWLHCFSLRLHV